MFLKVCFSLFSPGGWFLGRMKCWLAMTQLEIWAPPLLIWEVNLIKSKYLDAEIGMGYEICTSICLLLICSCFNRKPFRSAKIAGSPLEGKYPSDFNLSHCSVCNFSRNVHHLDRDVEMTEKKVYWQRNCFEKEITQKSSESIWRPQQCW